MMKLFGVVFVALTWLVPPALASSPPTVLASIKPVAMLIKAVVGDELAVEVLLSANTSPHEYALKFSDLRAVKQADLIVWVGPELEGVLMKALENVPSENVLQLTQLVNTQWPEESHKGHDHHGDAHEDSYNKDPHLWLSPDNSLLAVEAIKTMLANKYPEWMPLFEENAREFSEQIAVLDRAIRRDLEQVKTNGFVVVHDGYGHFVEHYDLNQLAAIQLAGGAKRGAHHYSEIIALADRVACVFTEPQLNNKAAIQLAIKLESNHTALDLMGSNTPLNQNSYIEFFSAFAETFVTCLDRKQAK